DERLDRLLLHIGREIDHHLTTTLDHAKDGRPFLLQCAPTRFALEATSTPLSVLLPHHFRLALVAGNHVGFVAFNFVCQGHRRLFFTIPSRSWVVIWCTSLTYSVNSRALCSFERCSPMQYRHNTQAFSG